jgi:hypothetical protein
MRSDDAPVEAGDARAENHPPPALLLHLGDAELCHEECRAAIRLPRVLKLVDGHLGNFLDPALQSEAGVVEEDGWMAEALDDGRIEATHLFAFVIMGIS